MNLTFTTFYRGVSGIFFVIMLFIKLQGQEVGILHKGMMAHVQDKVEYGIIIS